MVCLLFLTASLLQLGASKCTQTPTDTQYVVDCTESGTLEGEINSNGKPLVFSGKPGITVNVGAVTATASITIKNVKIVGNSVTITNPAPAAVVYEGDESQYYVRDQITLDNQDQASDVFIPKFSHAIGTSLVLNAQSPCTWTYNNPTLTIPNLQVLPEGSMCTLKFGDAINEISFSAVSAAGCTVDISKPMTLNTADAFTCKSLTVKAEAAGSSLNLGKGTIETLTVEAATEFTGSVTATTSTISADIALLQADIVFQNSLTFGKDVTFTGTGTVTLPATVTGTGKPTFKGEGISVKLPGALLSLVCEKAKLMGTTIQADNIEFKNCSMQVTSLTSQKELSIYSLEIVGGSANVNAKISGLRELKGSSQSSAEVLKHIALPMGSNELHSLLRETESIPNLKKHPSSQVDEFAPAGLQVPGISRKKLSEQANELGRFPKVAAGSASIRLVKPDTDAMLTITGSLKDLAVTVIDESQSYKIFNIQNVDCQSLTLNGLGEANVSVGGVTNKIHVEGKNLNLTKAGVGTIEVGTFSELTLDGVGEMPVLTSPNSDSVVRLLNSHVTITAKEPKYRIINSNVTLSTIQELTVQELVCQELTLSGPLTLTGSEATNQMTVSTIKGLTGTFTLNGGNLAVNKVSDEQPSYSFVVNSGTLSIAAITTQQIDVECSQDGCFDVHCREAQPVITLKGSGTFQLDISEFSEKKVNTKGLVSPAHLVLTAITDFKQKVTVNHLSLYDSTLTLDRAMIKVEICEFRDSNIILTGDFESPPKKFYFVSCTVTGKSETEKEQIVENIYFSGVVTIDSMPIRVTKCLYTVNPRDDSENSIFLENCVLYLGTNSQDGDSSVEYSDGEGIPTFFSFYGNVVFSQNTEHWLNKNSFFFSDVTYQDGVNLSNAIGPIIKTENQIYCESGKLELVPSEVPSSYTMKCCHACSSTSSPAVPEGLVKCGTMSAQITDGKITCQNGEISVDQSVYVIDYANVAHSILVSLSEFQGSTYSYEEVKLNIVNPTENAFQIRAVRSELSYLAAGTTFQTIDLSDGSKINCYASAIAQASITLDSSQLRFIYEKSEAVPVASVDAVNSILDTDFENGKNTKQTSLSISKATLQNVTLGNITATITSIAVQEGLALSESYIRIPKGNQATFTDSVLSSYKGNITCESEIVFSGSLVTNASIICVNSTSDVKLKLDSTDEQYFGCFSLNCRVTYSSDIKKFAFGDGSFYFGVNFELKNDGGSVAVSDVEIVIRGNATLDNAIRTGVTKLSLEQGGSVFFENTQSVAYSLSGTGTVYLASGNFEKELTLSDSKLIFSGNLNFKQPVSFSGRLELDGAIPLLNMKFTSVSFSDCALQSRNLVNIDVTESCTFQSKAVTSSSILLADPEPEGSEWKNVYLTSDKSMTVQHTGVLHMRDCRLNVRRSLTLTSGSIEGLELLALEKTQVSSTNGSIGSASCSFHDNTFKDKRTRFACTNVEYDQLNEIGKGAMLEFANTETMTNSVFLVKDESSKVRFVNNKGGLDLHCILDFQPQNDYELFTWTVKPSSMPKIDSKYHVDFTNRHFVVYALKCPSGQAPAADGSCTACPPGQYSNKDKCLPCPVGTYANSSGLGSCLACPYNTYSASEGLSVCSSCPDHMITLSTGSSSASDCWCASGYLPIDDVCTECTPGYDCSEPKATYSDPSILKGYYADETGVYKCNTEAACLGHRCADGYESFKCAKCAKGYYLLSYGLCQKCPGREGFLYVICGMFTIAAYIVVFCVPPLRDRLTPIVPLLFAWQHFTQLITVFSRFNIEYHASTGIIFQIFEGFNLDFHKMIQCIDSKGVWSQGIFYLLLDAILLFVFIAYLGWQCYVTRKSSITGNQDTTDGGNRSTKTEEDILLEFLQPSSNTGDEQSSSSSLYAQRKKDYAWAVYLGVLLLMSGAQMSWFFSVATVNRQGEIRRYDYLQLFKGEWLRFFAVVFIVFLFIFVPIIAILIAIPLILSKRMSTFQFYRIFGYVAMSFQMGSWTSLLCVSDAVMIFIIHCLNAIINSPRWVACITSLILIARFGLFWWKFYSSSDQRRSVYRYATVTFCAVLFLLGCICDIDDNTRSEAGASIWVWFLVLSSIIACPVILVILFFRPRTSHDDPRQLWDEAFDKEGFELWCIQNHPMIEFLNKKRDLGAVLEWAAKDGDKRRRKWLKEFILECGVSLNSVDEELKKFIEVSNGKCNIQSLLQELQPEASSAAGNSPEAPSSVGNSPEAPSTAGSQSEAPSAAGTQPEAPSAAGSQPEAPSAAGSQPEAPSAENHESASNSRTSSSSGYSDSSSSSSES